MFMFYILSVVVNHLKLDSELQGLRQDFRNACLKQQFQKFCPSRFSYSAISNPYTNYIYSLLCQKGQFTLEACPIRCFVSKVVGFYSKEGKIEYLPLIFFACTKR